MTKVVDYITENWTLIICWIATAYLIFEFGKEFVLTPSNKKIERIKKWLLKAVEKANVELDTAPGKAKLAVVYSAFVRKFPWASRLITLDMFCNYVDEALDKLEEALEDTSNNKEA